MGLELVELAFRLEEEFEITIPDEVAEKLTTPRAIVDYIAAIPSVSTKWSRDYVEITVWLAVEDELGIDRNEFNLDSRFVQDMGAG